MLIFLTYSTADFFSFLHDSPTYPINVSSIFMNVANDTTTATSHGFTPGFTALFEVLRIDMAVSFYLKGCHRRQWPLPHYACYILQTSPLRDRLRKVDQIPELTITVHFFWPIGLAISILWFIGIHDCPRIEKSFGEVLNIIPPYYFEKKRLQLSLALKYGNGSQYFGHQRYE